jgi:hypothetical protein
VLLVSAVVPISDDYFQAPGWLKCVITLGHGAAVWAMFYPARGKGSVWKVLAGVAAGFLSLWAMLQVGVMWFWNSSCRTRRAADRPPQDLPSASRSCAGR